MLNSDTLRQQLQRLQAARPLPVHGPHAPKEAAPAAPGSTAPAAAPDDCHGSVPLEQLVPGEVVETSAGSHYRVVRSLTRWFQGLHAGQAPRPGLVSVPASAASQAEQPAHPDLVSLQAAFPRDVLFMDLETCGFAGSQIFLVGTLYHGEAGLMLDQRFARDYREEASILEAFWHLAQERQVLATFNGKSFDWPMVCDRTACHRLPQQNPFGVHADLLHHARRAWKLQIPNCRLKTLESWICQRHRGADIPGSQIPAAYHGFVRSGDARPIRTILYHNAMDLITLAELAWHLTSSLPQPGGAASPSGNPASHLGNNPPLPPDSDLPHRSSSAA